jgi:hypothetical protein
MTVMTPKGKPTNKYLSQVLRKVRQEADTEPYTWITRPTTHCGMESTRTSTNATTQEGNDWSDEVQPQEESPDGPSEQEGSRTSSRHVLLQLPRRAHPEGCCAPDGTLLRAGLAWAFIGPHGPRSAASDPRGTLSRDPVEPAVGRA